jgi:cell division protein FtsZ
MRRVCDAVIPLPNDALMQEGADNETVLDSFARADEWIGRGVKSIWAMLFRTGLINLDFATLRQAFQTRGGKTLFGLGSGDGRGAVAQAVESLKLCPLLTMPEYARRADRLLVNITGGTDLTLPKVNELMSAVTEQFGKDSHVIMGAVIDEAMQGRVEVCVLGTTDLGGRGMASRRPSSAHRSARSGFPWTAPAPAPAATQPVSPAAKAEVAAHAEATPKTEIGAAARAKIDQEEFTFGELESRGHFENTDRNLFEGQDLDVPTYLRRGIKIVL